MGELEKRMRILNSAANRQRAKDMNLLDSPRVGWEQKKTYQDHLAELSANGYLNAEEYQARMEWLQDAKTEAEMKIVFTDLPSVRVTKVELAPYLKRPPVKPKKNYIFGPKVAAAGFIIEAVITIINGSQGQWGAAGVTLFAALIWGVVFLMRINGK
jgi:hypothetical protein